MLDLIHRCTSRPRATAISAASRTRSEYVDGAGKKQAATAFSWEKTDKADELRKAAKLK